MSRRVFYPPIIRLIAAFSLGALAWSPLGWGSSPLKFSGAYPRYQEPDYLTFDELVKLSVDPHPGGELEDKLERFWKTPLISNEAFYAGARPLAPSEEKLGPFLGVASWNIEKSLRTADVIRMLTSDTFFKTMIDYSKVKPKSPLFAQMEKQRARVLQSDVILLQEMDIGVKRSGYINAAADIAKALNMNYAYATEQLEIDPVVLGTEQVHNADDEHDPKMSAYFAADPKKYKGLFGQAVLSRYPIKRAECFQLKHQAYNWFYSEKKKTPFLERSRRLGTKALFKNELTREMKAGGRIYFRVDLDVPQLPEKTLTIINIHLEIKCQPKGREIQMAEILDYIKGIRNPVILMGDFNAAGTDLSPVSVSRTLERTAKDPTTWFQAAVTYLSPYALAINTTRGLSNVTKNFQDPFASDIPVVAPNKVKPMFELIENFRFDDGGAFDFRGDIKRSVNRRQNLLANSNQRDLKGFKTSFQVKRPIGPIFGKLRLDWVFVKSYLKDPHDISGSYQFAPHFGETLEELNTNMVTPFSDHHANVIDLPFEEPKIKTTD